MSSDTNDFIERSSLEVIIPEATDLGIEELFERKTDDSDEANSLLQQRSLLYFGQYTQAVTSFVVSLILRYVLDELITAYIVLRTPYQDEGHLRSFFARLVVSLEVHAYGSVPRVSGDQDASKDSSPSRNEDILWSGSIDMSQNPVTIIHGERQYQSPENVLAIWKTMLPLCRPRIRLQSPMIAFRPRAFLRPSKEEGRNKFKDPYLPSGVPASTNLLESLKSELAVQGAEPRLSAARLSRISPFTGDGDITDRSIKTSTQKAFRALPAVSSRVRYSRTSGRAGKTSVIASLDIETVPFSNEIVQLTAVDMALSDGSSEDLGKSLLPLLPLKCQPKDNPAFLFRLSPHETSSDNSTQSSARSVLVTVHATILVSPMCRPRIEMRWKTGVDFSTALNPIYGAPGQSMQRQRRPNNLSRTLSNNSLSSMPASNWESDSVPAGTEKRQRAVSVRDFGVSVTFTAPEKIRVGRPFAWNVLVLNCSSQPREFALTVLPKRKQNSSTGHSFKTPSVAAVDRPHIGIANSVMDENSLYAKQRNVVVALGEVINLSTDVRIGTLNPDSCIDVELKLLPLARGHLQLEAVRFTDVVSSESIDIRDLPDIVVADTAINE